MEHSGIATTHLYDFVVQGFQVEGVLLAQAPSLSVRFQHVSTSCQVARFEDFTRIANPNGLNNHGVSLLRRDLSSFFKVYISRLREHLLCGQGLQQPLNIPVSQPANKCTSSKQPLASRPEVFDDHSKMQLCSSAISGSKISPKLPYCKHFKMTT